MTPERSWIASEEEESAPCPRCDGPITGPHEYTNNQGEPGMCPWEREWLERRSAPGPAPILNRSLYVDAGRDSNGQPMVYLPCLFCAARHGDVHRPKCPGKDAVFTTPAPEEWSA